MSDEAVLIEALIERIEKLEDRLDALEKKPAKKKGAQPDGSKIFDAYYKAWLARYGIEGGVLRDSKINTQAKTIANRVGLEDGIELVEFYLKQNDNWFLMKQHPLSACLSDCESLYARMKGARKVSPKEAQSVAAAESNATASAHYLKKKYAATEA